MGPRVAPLLQILFPLPPPLPPSVSQKQNEKEREIEEHLKAPQTPTKTSRYPRGAAGNQTRADPRQTTECPTHERVLRTGLPNTRTFSHRPHGETALANAPHTCRGTPMRRAGPTSFLPSQHLLPSTDASPAPPTVPRQKLQAPLKP